MVRFNVFLLVLAATLIQATLCLDTCPYAFAPDGSRYDLSRISNQVHQYVQYTNGQQYTYNISICSPIPSGCAGACGGMNTAGVCQFWGPAPAQAKCLGSYPRHTVVGLNNGLGVQITYQGGDFCGSCNPTGPRTSIINLTCSSNVLKSKIFWTSVSIPQLGQDPVAYFNGTFYCPNDNGPVSTPYSAPYSPTNDCSYIYAPDGSFYDLSDLKGREFSTLVYDSQYQQYYNTSFSVCGGLSRACGNGACYKYGSAAACRVSYDQRSSTCWGQFDSTATVQGLNYDQGVVITYDHGDANDLSKNRQTVLRLTCSSWAFPSELYISQVRQVGVWTLYINATIGCYYSSSPSSTPWAGPQPSWTPSISPSSYNPNRHVSIQYYGYGSGCNGSDAFMVVVNRTRYCTPGCQIQGNKYVMTACDDDVYLPRGVVWVEQISYGDSYYCDTPQQATYKKSRQCGGTFDFSYQECDPNTVYTFSCNNPYCNNCQMISKTSTNICNYGTEYRCVHDFKGSAYPNPFDVRPH